MSIGSILYLDHRKSDLITPIRFASTIRVIFSLSRHIYAGFFPLIDSDSDAETALQVEEPPAQSTQLEYTTQQNADEPLLVSAPSGMETVFFLSTGWYWY